MTEPKNQRAVLLPDIHHPYYEEEAFAAVVSFIKWFKPHNLILLGDAMNMDSVNHWLQAKKNRKTMEGKRIRKEYDAFAQDILDPLERVAPNYCQLVYLGGNHEEWVYQLVEKDPRFEGLVEPDICLKLEERGWKWIPYLDQNARGTVRKNTLDIGKLRIFHGAYTNKYHANKVSLAYSKSMAYGHTHDVQRYTKTFEDDIESYHTCQSIGCLCQKNPPYLKGNPNKWVTAFGVVYTRKNGDYNLYVPIIVRGMFTFAGKIFKA